uniref:Uncharacterized protein n=1 Tax=Panagrolaimus sp. ES5 TaxID=591445 RepID=A0AC34GY38_9BILA
MIRLNSLFALRILNICLVIWLIFEICDRLKDDKAWKSFWGVQHEGFNKTELRWDTVNILEPPILNDTELEAMRLNEYFAKPQYHCSNRKLVGGPSDNFLLCFDKKFLVEPYFFGKTVVITGLTNSPAVFEAELNTTRWEAYLPPDSPIIDEFKFDVEVQYIPEVVEEDYFPMETIIDGIKDSTFAVAKLEFYSNHFKNDQLEKAPELVEKILDYLRTDQLLIQIRLEQNDATTVIPIWMKLLYRIFFKHSFALLGAHSNSACNRPLGHCIYRATFIKTSIFEVSEAPVWGLGSPGEERSRLFKYLKDLETNCTQVLGDNNNGRNDEIPYLCLDDEELDDCSVLYFRYRNLDHNTISNLKNHFGLCNIQINYPEPSSDLQLPKNIKIIQNGILSKTQRSNLVAGFSKTSQWQLKTFNDALSNFETNANRKKYLLFDLDGEEIEVLDSIVNDCAALKQYRQISFRLQIWFGEENKNYRNFYLHLLQLEKCGFSKVFSNKLKVSTVVVIFKRDSGFV